MPEASASYHHGDLRLACLRAARELLEEDGSAALSLRAVARRAGVSPTAPYRHYADRDALLSAVAADGYHELAARMVEVNAAPATPGELADVAVAYVLFAVDHPAMFRAMFSDPCGPDDPQRAEAGQAVLSYVVEIVQRAFPGGDLEATSTAVWALVHGLAFLHLDGKFDTADRDAMAARIRATVHAVLDR